MQPLVTCILPVRGRPEQTVAVAERLCTTAGDVRVEWLAVSGSDDQPITMALLGWQGWINSKPRLTYWQALEIGTRYGSKIASILCCLANDLDPAPGWLQNGLAAYVARFGHGHGLMGFSGDGHGPHHSCHFLIGRTFLAELGGWPTHYDHNFGDAELCERAQALGRYGKATRAVLNHRHTGRGLAPDDATYQEGARRWQQDEATFRERRHLWASA